MNAGIVIGDFVGILEGTERGYVIRIEKNKAWVETKDGFEITCNLNQLVKYDTIQKESVIPVQKKSTPHSSSISASKEKSETFPAEKKPVIRKVKDVDFKIHPHLIGEDQKQHSKKKQENVWEIDLHIEELTDDYKRLTNGEIVDIQLRHARMIIDQARKNKINKIVFIHGKGKGVLKQELLHLLAGYTFIEYYDASFKRYGGGATEARIFTSKV